MIKSGCCSLWNAPRWVVGLCLWMCLPSFAGMVGCSNPSTAAEASPRIPQIGYLGLWGADWPQGGTPRLEFFKQGLQQMGYIDGRNIAVDYRFADGDPDRLRQLASELASRPVEAIVLGDTAAIPVAREVTQTIPLIMIINSDPVGLRTIQSLARPGGNITGLTTMSFEINGKRLELLRETLPSTRTVAVLWQRTGGTPTALGELERVAPVLGLGLLSYEVGQPSEIDEVIARASADGADALFVLVNPNLHAQMARISELAVQNGLPLMAPTPEFVEAGALMTYAPSYAQLYRRAPWYVARILNGANPAELPVEQPSQFDLLINLHTADRLGISVPESILAQATQVIR